MSSLTSLALSPFALLFRISYAQPWVAIGISAVAGVVAHMLDHDGWTVLFVSFMSYLMMWLDETKHPRAMEQGPVEE
jgi:hypothetical protein